MVRLGVARAHRLSAVLIAVCLVIVAVPTARAQSANDGDANADGATNIGDLLTLLDHLVMLNPSPFSETSADYDADGLVDIRDAWLYLQPLQGATAAAATLPDASGSLSGASFDADDGLWVVNNNHRTLQRFVSLAAEPQLDATVQLDLLDPEAVTWISTTPVETGTVYRVAVMQEAGAFRPNLLQIFDVSVLEVETEPDEDGMTETEIEVTAERVASIDPQVGVVEGDGLEGLVSLADESTGDTMVILASHEKSNKLYRLELSSANGAWQMVAKAEVDVVGPPELAGMALDPDGTTLWFVHGDETVAQGLWTIGIPSEFAGQTVYGVYEYELTGFGQAEGIDFTADGTMLVAVGEPADYTVIDLSTSES